MELTEQQERLILEAANKGRCLMMVIAIAPTVAVEYSLN